MKRAIAPALLSLALCGAPLLAQDPPKVEMPAHAPKWKVGQSWEVEVFVPDLKEAVSGRPEQTFPELPGLPPLRNGVPKGFKRGGVFRVTVMGDKAKLDDPKADPEDGPSEPYWELKVETVGAKTARKAMVLYAVSDLSIGRLEYDLGTGKTSVLRAEGTAMLCSEANNAFGFPFDWPDLSASAKPSAELKDGRRSLVQESKPAEGEPKGVNLKLYEKPGKAKAKPGEKEAKPAKPVGIVRTEWRKDQPWWTSYSGPGMEARLRIVEKKP